MQRQTTLSIDLGGERVNLVRCEAAETFSEPFEIALHALAPLGEIDLLPHLGAGATVSVAIEDEPARIFHGILVEAELMEEDTGGAHYHLMLRPWTHLLAHNRNFAIHQDKTAIDIIKETLKANEDIARVDYSKLSRTPAKRIYCVQYGESDFAFISRLMEEEGIYYFFRHERDRHVMVLCDAPGAHSGSETLHHNPVSGSMSLADSQARNRGAGRFVQSWNERVASAGETQAEFRDFDFKAPQQPLVARTALAGGHKLDRGEVYDYPGRYLASADGEALTQAYIEGRRAARRTYRARSQYVALACGAKFKLDKHVVGRFNGDYVIVSTRHAFASETYVSGANESASNGVEFTAIPAATRWRAPRKTVKPVARGPETAIITGPDGEEIFTDDYGRVKVRFHWDRAGTKNEVSSCWMRVAQTGGLGNIILPRVGHEVIVDFIDGDPDRPVVVGRVFNQANMPIYELPANKTRALWRTKTYGTSGSYSGAMSLDTGAPRCNELRFEDKGGEEEVFLHAERDMNTRVRYKESRHIGLDQEIKVGQDRSENVLRSEEVKIGKDRSHEVTDHDTLKIGKTLNIEVGQTIEIKAGTSITFVVGQTKIVMDQTSIKLDTTMYNMNAQGMADLKSPMTTVKGDGILTLKGGMTLIN